MWILTLYFQVYYKIIVFLFNIHFLFLNIMVLSHFIIFIKKNNAIINY